MKSFSLREFSFWGKTKPYIRYSGISKILLLIGLTIFCNSGLQIFGQIRLPAIRIEKFTVADGLSHNLVTGITEDKNGFMWFTTYNGIDRYDGYNFKHYITDKTNPENRYYFNDIQVDRKGKLWACDIYGKLYLFLDSLERFDSWVLHDYNTALQKLFFDSKNNLWIGNGHGVSFLKDGESPENIKLYQLVKPNTITTAIAEDKSGKIWAGTHLGLFVFANNKDSIYVTNRYLVEENKAWHGEKNWVYNLYSDRSNNLWMGSDGIGLRKIEVSDNLARFNDSYIPTKKFDNEISGSNILGIIPYKDNFLFVRSDKGIFLVKSETGEAAKICSEGALEGMAVYYGAPHNAFYYSNDGILWFGTIDGLYKVTFDDNIFQCINNFKPAIPDPQPLRTSQVLSDSKGRLWVGTVFNGLHVGIKDKNGVYDFKNYPYKGAMVYYLNEAKNGNVWISFGHFQRATSLGNNIEIFWPPAYPRPYETAEETYSVNQISEYNGKLWVCYTFKGFRIYDTLTWKPKYLSLGKRKNVRYKESPLYYYTKFPYAVFYSKDSIFLRDEFGIYMIGSSFLHRSDSVFPEKADTLLRKPIMFPQGKFLITKGKNGLSFWIPSRNNGVYWYFMDNRYDGINKGSDALKFVTNLNANTGLSNNIIYDILEDKNGKIWISTMNGLNIVNPETGIIQTFYEQDGLPDNRFNFGSSSDKDGSLYFCNVKGIVRFHPDSLVERPSLRNIYITRVSLFDRSIDELDDPDLRKPLHFLRELKFRYNQNFLSFEFAAINYLSAKTTKYKYIMEGLNNEWINSGERRYADYQDLKPGKYTFRVQASEPDGTWSKKEARIDIIITPPFWKRAWFIIIIICLLITAVAFYIKYRERKLKERTVWLENQVKEKTEIAIKSRIDLEHMKSRFYTNISHEFRTPLTLINNSAMELRKDLDEVKKSRFINTILNSGARLLKLVNELLDLSRIEAGKLELKVSEGDIAALSRFVCQTYISDAERRGINYTFNSDKEKIICWFDREFVMKILHNLVSNALKFTPAGGTVSTEIKLLHKYDLSFKTAREIKPPFISIEVKDTGKGISGEHIPKIFDRFYQADNSDTRQFEGTGIGLSIVNELVKRHYGDIKVESTEGKGSSFTVILPVGKETFREEEISREAAPEEKEVPDTPVYNEVPVAKGNSGVTEIEKPLVLIAEDNDDLRIFLADLLKENYRVAEAVTGKEALEKANLQDPEIIVSDIMMPEMDGLELCASIKGHVMTSHIPVILLTARADIESRLEGLKTGADDYLEKPFNEEELLIRIQNLLKQREILREKFFSSPLSDMPAFHGAKCDEEFISLLLKTVEANLSNGSFSVEDLAAAINTGHRTLIRKTKALTGLSPVELIRMIRIKHAASLIRNKKMTITEAAYATGFSSPSYFTRIFREVMGANPSEYIAS